VRPSAPPFLFCINVELVVDPPYGYFQGFKPYPSLPAQVYAFHPPTGTIRVVADGFERPNGVQFSEDFKTCYVTDTGFISAVAGDPHPDDGRRPGTMYVLPFCDLESLELTLSGKDTPTM
jgi:gluconolactonase